MSTWTATSGANQRWTVVDETVLRTETVQAYTVPGLAPTLPQTVTAVYRDGARGSLPVVWTLPPLSRWREPGTVRVRGTATDPLGRTIAAEAAVTVDVFGSTRPGRAKTYVGGQPDLPPAVTGVGRHGGTADLPVTWDPVSSGAFDRVGVVTLHGTARVVDGSLVPATVRVQVTEPVEVNVAPDSGVVASATFTESGYSADGVRNGNLTDKAWSNWKPGDTKNPSDTVTLTLPRARDLSRVVTHFYRDGTNASSAERLTVQVQTADGSWVDASGEVPVPTEGAPVIDVPVTAGPAVAVRVVMTARPSGYMTLSEIEIFAKAPGVSADATVSSIEVDGVPVPGFQPDTATYQVVARHPDRCVVTATASDPYAAVAVTRTGGSGARQTVTVAVTSEDGAQTRTYQVELVSG